jgi:DNA helicase IV / RNA helicase N terminal
MIRVTEDVCARDWGSTGPGAWLTGSDPWRAELDGDRLSLLIERRQPLSLHLVQLRSLQVAPGMVWARCHFEFQAAEGQFTRTVHGIPNAQALQMQQAIGEATTAT